MNEIQIKPGKAVWMEKCDFTKKIRQVNVLIYWKKNESDPWCLATDLPDAKITKMAYTRRMRIEEMFGDLKKKGFDLKRTMINHSDRLSRLTLAVALLYVWLVFTGRKIIRNGHRKLVDHSSRRDIGIFLKLLFALLNAFLLTLCPFPYLQAICCNFWILSGG